MLQEGRRQIDGNLMFYQRFSTLGCLEHGITSLLKFLVGGLKIIIFVSFLAQSMISPAGMMIFSESIGQVMPFLDWKS